MLLSCTLNQVAVKLYISLNLRTAKVLEELGGRLYLRPLLPTVR